MKHLSLCRLLRTLCFALLVAVTPGAWAQVNGPVCDTYTNKTKADGLGYTNNVLGVYVVGSTVYAALDGGGLDISTDGGSSFTDSGLEGDNVSNVYVVGSTVYAATLGRGLGISTDGGRTFTNKTDADGLGSNNVFGVYAVGSTVYAATVGTTYGTSSVFGGGLSISTDGGRTFTNYTQANGLGSINVIDVYVVGSTIYAATAYGLSISTDGGNTFTNKTTANGLGCNYVNDVYVVGSTVYAATGCGLSISTNGGISFTNYTAASGLGSSEVSGVYALGSTVYAATSGGLSISTNGGRNFTNYTEANGLGSNRVQGVYALDGKVYAATKGGLSFCPEEPLVLTDFTAGPPRLVTTGSTSLSAAVRGGKPPYSYVFSGPGVISQATNRNTASLSGLSVGVQTFTVVVSDAISPTQKTTTGTVSVTVTAPVPGGPACDYYTNKTTANGLGDNYVSNVQVVGSTVYAATGGGLSISTDGGNTFTTKTTANGLGCNYVNDVYVVGSMVYATTGCGLSISTNGGSSFTTKTTANGLGSNEVYGVYALGSTVYAATRGGLSISTNGGSSFTTKTTANGLGDNFVNGVYALDGKVYAATDAGLSISTDGGSTFTNKTPYGLLYNATNGVYVVGSTVYAATYGSGLVISTDGGSTFYNKTTGDGLGDNVVYNVYALGSTVYAATRGGLSISTNGGSSFTNYTANGLGSNRVNDVYVLSNKLYAATSGGLSACPAAVPPLVLTGFTVSPAKLVTTGITSLSAAVTGGKTPYSYVFSGPGVISQATTSNTASLTVLGVGVQTFTVVVSDSFSQTTTGTVSVTVTAPVPGSGPACDTFTRKTDANGLGNNSVFGVSVVGSTVYAATFGGGLSISTDGGRSFTNKTTANGLGSNYVRGVYAVGSTVYAATDGGLSISIDGGISFTNKTTANGLGSNTLLGVYVVGSTVYAATDYYGLSISTDGGRSFITKTIANGLGNNTVRGVYAVGNMVYAATEGGLGISTDGGSSFTNRNTGNGLGSNYVSGVYVVGSTVYAATYGYTDEIEVVYGGGLSISTDGGRSFTNKTTANGLGSNKVSGVYVVGSTVYAATYPVGVVNIKGGGLSISTNEGFDFTNYTAANGLGSNYVNGVYAVGSTVYAAAQGGLSFCQADLPLVLNGFTVGPASVCAGNGVTFTATVANVTGSYAYTLTNGASTTTGSSSNPAFSQPLTASGSGLQTFTLTVSSQGEVATATTSLTVTRCVTLSGLAASPNPVCAGQSIAFRATLGNLSGSYSYTLSGGSNTTSGTGTTSAFTQPLTAGGSGVQSFTLTVATPDQRATATTNVTVNQCLTSTGQAPGRNERYAPVQSNVNLLFNQVLSGNAATLGGVRVFSAQRGGLLRNGQGGTASVVLVGGNSNRLSFSPATDFKPGETVFVTSTTAIQSAGGNTAPRQVYQFTTGVRGSGQGYFTPPATNPNPGVGDTPFSVAVGDVDGDGDLDLLTANRGNNTVSVRLNNGSGNFTPPATNPNPGVGNGPRSVALGDVDGDGDLDLLTANELSDNVSVRLNDESGHFTAPATNPNPGVGNAPVGVALGDVDGDGDLDLLTVNYNSDNVSVRLNDGSGNFTAPAINPNPGVGDYPQSVALGDVDGDGDLDLVTANYNSNTVSVRLNDGSGNFTPPASNPNPGVGSGANSVALGDVDGDGDLDLLCANRGNNTVSVRLNDGSGNFTPPATNPNPGVGSAPYSVVLGDVDGDGDLDLLSANGVSNTVSVRLNDGSGNFTPPATNPNPGAGSAPYSVALGDVDGDGDLDLLTANGVSDNVSVRLNVVTVTGSTPTLAGLAVSPNPVCVDQPFTIAASVGNFTTGYSYTLTNGTSTTTGSSSSAAFSQTLVANGSGVQTVTLTVSSAGQSATATTTLAVNAPPTPTLAASNGGLLSCTQPSLTLTAGGGTNYAFSGPGVVSQMGNTAIVNAAGVYSMTVTNAETGCSSTTTTSVTSTTDAPTVSISASATALTCASPTVNLTALGTGSVRWSTGETSPSISVSVAGTYSVTLTSGGSCTATARATIQQDLAPPTNASLSSGTLSCSQTSLTLTASATGGVSYRFSGGTPVGVGQVVVTTAGVYSVTITGANGCTTVAQATVSGSVEEPVAFVRQPASASSVAVGASVTTTVSVRGSGPLTYQWYKDNLTNPVPNQTSATLSLTNVQLTDAGSYSVVVTGSCGIGTPTGLTSTAFTLAVTAPNPLLVTLTADPLTLVAGGATSLSATVSGGTQPYAYQFSGPGVISPAGATARVTDLPVGVQSFTVVVSDATRPVSLTSSATVSVTVSAANTAPTLANAVNSQTATVGQSYSISLANTFTDQETPNSLTLSATGLPGGLSLVGTTLSGTASLSGVSTVVLTATDPGSLSATTSFVLTVSPAPVVNTAPTVANAISSQTATVGQSYSLNLATTFTDQQTPNSLTLSASGLPAGLTLVGMTLSGTASLSGVSTVTLIATDPGSLSASTSFVLTVSPAPVVNTAPTVANAISSQTATVGQSYSLNLATTFTDQQTPNSLTLSASGLPGGLSLVGTTLSGTPSVSGVSTVVLTATDPGSLTATTSFVLTVSPAPVVNTAPTVANAISSQTATVGQSFILELAGTFTDQQTPNSLTLSASGLPAGLTLVGTTLLGTASLSGVSTVVLTATDPGSLSASTSFVLTVSPAPVVNTAPTVANAISSQTATVGQSYSISLANTFTDQQTPNSLTLSASGLPAGLTLVGTTLSGTASLSGVSTVVLTATDPGSLSATTSFVLTVSPASSGTTTASFAITSVTTVSCTPVGDRITIRFTPQYSGTTGQPIRFSVVNELSATTNAGPYTLSLYADNPAITLSAVQAGSGAEARFVYNWLAACNNPNPGGNTAPTLANAISSQTATVGVGYSLNLAATFTDQETPNSLSLSATGLPAGLSLVGTTLSGTPSVSGVSTVVLTATDPGSLTASTSFVLTVSPAPVVNTAPTVANSVSSQTATVGQSFVLNLAGTFTDQETPNSLTLSATGLPAGLSLVGTTLSGTPSLSGVSTVVLTATDPGSLTASTSFVLTVLPPTGTPPPTAPFAITSVTTLSCTPVGDRINISFAPQYTGITGQPIRFSVVNELSATTNAGPYTLSLYADNPAITLSAVQAGSGAEARFVYNWLAACNNPNPGGNTAPTLANAISSQTATVGQNFGLNLAGTFTDQETPNQLILSATGLPTGLNLVGTTIRGTASVSGVSTVTITATDPGSLSASTSFQLTVSPASSTTVSPPTGTFRITGATAVSCEVVRADLRKVTFTPQYTGVSGEPVSFSVVNELSPTTDAGPYTLNLYTDNPVITLSAQQGSTTTRYAYSWLASCPFGARSAAPEVGTGLQVVVLGNPVLDNQLKLEVRGAQGQPLQVSLVDERGRRVGWHEVGAAGLVETHSFALDQQPAGVLLLRVSTPGQTQTLKVLKR